MASKTRTPLTDEKILELNLQLETELGRTARQLRVLQREHGALSSRANLAKQKRVLGILIREKGNILTDLSVATSSNKKKGDAKVRDDLIYLLKSQDSFNIQIYKKQANMREIENDIERVKKQLIHITTQFPSVIQYQNRVSFGRKTLEGLENKLDTAIKKCCTIVAENRQRRDEIDHLLIERISFNIIWFDMIAKLNKGKKLLMDIIEQSTIAFNQREELCVKLQVLRTMAQNDIIIHTQEMHGLQRQIDNDSKLHEFFAVKHQLRNMKQLQDKNMQKKQDKRETIQNTLQKYNKTLDEIMAFTGTSSMDRFTTAYSNVEIENMSKFNYINLLRKEMEDVTSQIVNLHIGISNEQLPVRKERGEHQMSKLSKMRAELNKLKDEVKANETVADKMNETMRRIYKGISKLFKMCKCSDAPFMELLGDNSKINDYNVFLFLNILENRITKIILEVYFKEKKGVPKKGGKVEVAKIINEKLFPRSVHLITDIVPTNPCPLCVDRELVSDVIDTLQFVQVKSEVDDKLQRRLLLPGGLARLHNVSACQLPKSRQIIQKRYQ